MTLFARSRRVQYERAQIAPGRQWLMAAVGARRCRSQFLLGSLGRQALARAQDRPVKVVGLVVPTVGPVGRRTLVLKMMSKCPCASSPF